MLNKVRGSTPTLIVGIAAFAFGLYKFAELAILPRLGR